jgi:hypothetical protein
MTAPAWLPPLIYLNDHGGDWQCYVEAVYARFRFDFIDSTPTFQGRRLGLKRYPLSYGKEATFWHFTSTGENEQDRRPDLRRCERIAWPRAVITNAGASSVKQWVEPRGSEPRVHLWLESEDYLLVLADRGEFLLPWTAFVVEHAHSRRKLQQRYMQYGNP